MGAVMPIALGPGLFQALSVSILTYPQCEVREKFHIRTREASVSHPAISPNVVSCFVQSELSHTWTADSLMAELALSHQRALWQLVITVPFTVRLGFVLFSSSMTK